MTETTAEAPLVPEDARVLHIGPPKTGSTALQASMHTMRDQMRQHGVLHVASDQRGRQTVLAALMEADFSEETNPRLFKRWQKLVDEIAGAGDVRVCLSNESMGRVDEPVVSRMVSALGGERAHVVAVARRLDKLLPSQWQEWVRVGRTSLTYADWLKVVLGDNPDDRQWREFWTPHDLRGMVSRWAGATSPDRFTLVIADEDDPTWLSTAFEQLLGLPSGLLAPADVARANVSASLERVEVVRRLNELLDEQDWPADLKEALRARVSKRIRSLAPGWSGETSIPALPAWARDRVLELNAERERLVPGLGVQVLGDPAKLDAPLPEASAQLETSALVSAELAAQGALSVMTGAVELLDQQHAEDQKTIARLRRKARRNAGGSEPLSAYSMPDLLAELRRRAFRRRPR